MTSAAPGAGERILMVDDEPDLRNLFLFNFREAGFAPEAVGTAQEAFEAVARARPHVIILDLMLPDLPGTEVCRRMREDPQLADVAIVMLTARGDEYDRILGFEVGADDYVVKPFSVRELVLRVRALMRRMGERAIARKVGAETQGTRHKWRGLEVDTVRHRVYMDGQELGLRPLEYKLLTTLLDNPERTFTRKSLLEEVWGASGDLNTRTVDTHVRRLRERLGAYGELVETVHSVGYRLRRP
jgi:two-component system phosphate regulon response regulator PhoB